MYPAQFSGPEDVLSLFQEIVQGSQGGCEFFVRLCHLYSRAPVQVYCVVRIQVYSAVLMQVNYAVLWQVYSVRVAADLSICPLAKGVSQGTLWVLSERAKSPQGMQKEPLIGLNNHHVEEAGFVS